MQIRRRIEERKQAAFEKVRGQSRDNRNGKRKTHNKQMCNFWFLSFPPLMKMKTYMILTYLLCYLLRADPA